MSYPIGSELGADTSGAVVFLIEGSGMGFGLLIAFLVLAVAMIAREVG